MRALLDGFGVLFVILNSFGLDLRLTVGKLLAEAFAHWKIAAWALVINFRSPPRAFGQGRCQIATTLLVVLTAA